MQLLFLHGLPAAGKLTIGRELAAITGFRLFHNHLTVDLVLSVYDFGTPGFVALRDTIWREVLTRAAADDLPGLIFTFNPESSVPQEFVDWVLRDPAGHGATVLSIEVSTGEAEIERRIASADRQAFRKLTDIAMYRELRTRGVFASPVIPRTDCRVDSGVLPPRAAALAIAEKFALRVARHE